MQVQLRHRYIGSPKYQKYRYFQGDNLSSSILLKRYIVNPTYRNLLTFCHPYSLCWILRSVFYMGGQSKAKAANLLRRTTKRILFVHFLVVHDSHDFNGTCARYCLWTECGDSAAVRFYEGARRVSAETVLFADNSRILIAQISSRAISPTPSPPSPPLSILCLMLSASPSISVFLRVRFVHIYLVSLSRLEIWLIIFPICLKPPIPINLLLSSYHKKVSIEYLLRRSIYFGSL